MKAPAFQFYAADFLVGIMGMTDEEVGIYIKMLAIQWERGALPSEPGALKALLGCRRPPSSAVTAKFELCADMMLRNSRLESERNKQKEFRESRAQNARKRWGSGCISNARASTDEMHVHESSTYKTDALLSPSPSSPSGNIEQPPVARGGVPVPKSIEELRVVANQFQPTSSTREKPDAGFIDWWWDEQEKRGWTDPQNGRQLHNWKAAFSGAWRAHFHRRTERAAKTYGPPKPSRAEQPRHDSSDKHL